MAKKSVRKSTKKEVSKFPRKEIYIGVGVGIIIGIIVGILITGTTIKTAPSLIQTYCEIDMQTLYEKPCAATEECYGRLELCSASLHKCMTTVQIDKTDIRNIRIPDTKDECEANSGVWKVKTVTASN